MLRRYVSPSSPASHVVIRRYDGTHVMLAHLREIRVKEGVRGRLGEPIGRVGNDAYPRHPHIHLGAWRDDRPLQIRFDLRAMGKLLSCPGGKEDCSG